MRLPTRNQLTGTVTAVNPGAVSTDVMLGVPD